VVVLGYRIRPLLVCALAAKLIAVLLWYCTTPRLAAAIAFFGPDPFVLYALFAPSAQGICRTYTHFLTERPAVWLTIDDGPDEHDTPLILDLLDRDQARATFFVIGERAAHQPDLLREIIRRGHTIGHHTHTHPAGTFWCASSRRLAAELDATIATLSKLGVQTAWFRPPVGIKNLFLEHALATRGLRCVGWSARSGDCHSNSPEQIVSALEPNLKPGAILLLHEGPSVRPAVRVRGIALLLETLSARGLKCEIPEESQLN
jgi:peptidoglycan/xylan/chitin deacetylase (PgdA/CDA1 family)